MRWAASQWKVMRRGGRWLNEIAALFFAHFRRVTLLLSHVGTAAVASGRGSHVWAAGRQLILGAWAVRAAAVGAIEGVLPDDVFTQAAAAPAGDERDDAE